MGELVQTVDRTQETSRREIPWDMSVQESTQRVKSVRFGDISTADEIAERGFQIWQESQHLPRFQHPLTQVRAIMPIAEEDKLLDYADQINTETTRLNAQTAVVGRIPFRHNGQDLGIYYFQTESNSRPVYRNGNWLTHEQAIAEAMKKKQMRIDRELPPGFTVKVLECTEHGARDILTGREEKRDMAELAAEIAAVHKLAFAYPHDPAQQTPEGAYAILQNNPVAIAFGSHNEVASVGYFEQDDRFTYGGIKLIEPTYFTHPGEEYRRHGLSSHLRMATQMMSQKADSILTWGGNAAVIFNESIRNSSFLLSQYHCELAGNANGRISGNLGDAYTAIGPANPDIGYMPMGLTYYPLHQSIRI